MAVPTYKAAVQWIAENDEPTWYGVDSVALMLTVVLVADLFGKTPEDVAKSVVRYRRTHFV
jgi:cbb3-type cytochrome oxidase subunit 1